MEYHRAHRARAADSTCGSADAQGTGATCPKPHFAPTILCRFRTNEITAFVQHMFSSYSTLFLQLEGLRHCSPSKPYTNKEGLPQKRASAEEWKVYLCSLTQDPNFINLCPFLSFYVI